ncbi:MAG TPA: hypothetical protein VKB90_16090 [Candidatus Acidoferrum sp.]|nr:hypothetical protein [Candidatus Acidoferrum sp.]
MVRLSLEEPANSYFVKAQRSYAFLRLLDESWQRRDFFLEVWLFLFNSIGPPGPIFLLGSQATPDATANSRGYRTPQCAKINSVPLEIE